MRVKRAHWIGDVCGEKRSFGERSGTPEFWNGVALLTQRQIIETAGAKALAAVGTDIGEANVSKEKEVYAAVKMSDADRMIAVGRDGVVTIPAAATTKPESSTGRILFANSVLGGKQLHYGRTGGRSLRPHGPGGHADLETRLDGRGERRPAGRDAAAVHRRCLADVRAGRDRTCEGAQHAPVLTAGRDRRRDDQGVHAHTSAAAVKDRTDNGTATSV
jgi:hypothetical protein